MGCNCGGSRERRQLMDEAKKQRAEAAPRRRRGGPLEGIYWSGPKRPKPQQG